MASSSHLQSPVSLSTDHGKYAVNQGSATDEPQKGQISGRKRKRTTPPTKPPKKDERKKVTRACDICKTKKLRCSGTLPCDRCANQSLDCEYNFEHRRGRPASPEPGVLGNLNNDIVGHPSTPSSQQLEQGQAFDGTINGAIEEPTNRLKKSSRSSQEADETRFEGDYIGPTSGIAFLHRAQRRFQQDFVGSVSSSFNGQGAGNTSVFSFGDGWVPDYSNSDFVFPDRREAKHLLDRYFDFAMPTYRFLHRSTVNAWLESLCSENESTQRPILSSAKHAIVLLTLATAKLYGEDATGLLRDGGAKDSEESGTFFAEAERQLSKESGPVRLESVQARLAQCMYLLASSRINQAWYIFGTATQMILALGLHRKRYSQVSGANTGLIGIECRKRVFWSAYTLDRYLSVILGRPRIFRDEDVDQHLPDRINDTDLASGRSKTSSAYNQCVSDGPVFHAKLAKIIGEISSDLYPTNRSTETRWMESAERWTTELKAWKESLPAFLEPSKVDPSILVPIFQRQSTVLRLAYAHALILANRPSLLNNFGDLSRPQGLPQKTAGGSVMECIDAANLVVDTVNGFIEEGKMCKAFWFTHYISFCAIATLYVYTIQQSLPHPQNIDEENGDRHESNLPFAREKTQFFSTNYFEAAEKCQRSIAETTAKTSPFRRYNIILDELKREVLQRLGRISVGESSTSNFINVQSMHGELPSGDLMDSSGRSSTRPYQVDLERFQGAPFQLQSTETTQPQGCASTNAPFDIRSSGNSSSQQFDEAMLDLNLFGSQRELMGWSEFDSCAINWADGIGMFELGIGL